MEHATASQAGLGLTARYVGALHVPVYLQNFYHTFPQKNGHVSSMQTPVLSQIFFSIYLPVPCINIIFLFSTNFVQAVRQAPMGWAVLSIASVIGPVIM